MTSSPFTDLFSSLPGLAEIRQMEDECAKIDEAILDLQTRRQRYGQLIEIARTLVGERPGVAVDLALTANESKAAAPRLKKGGVRRKENTWKAAIALIVKAHPEGIEYDRIKEIVPDRLKSQLVQFPEAKGFYTALRKLEAEKVVKRVNGVAFTLKGYEAYRQKLAEGLINEITTGRRGSPIESAVLAFLKSAGPSKGPSIRADLIKYEGFGKSVIRNSSAMYNALKRLVDRGEIVRDIEAATYRLPDENEAPNGSAVGASEAGEALTSPNDAQPSLRLVG